MHRIILKILLSCLVFLYGLCVLRGEFIRD